MVALDDKSVIGISQKLTTPISHMDSLPWTPFAAMRAQQQVSAAKELKPVVHSTSGVQGYETVKSVSLVLHHPVVKIDYYFPFSAVGNTRFCSTAHVQTLHCVHEEPINFARHEFFGFKC